MYQKYALLPLAGILVIGLYPSYTLSQQYDQKLMLHGAPVTSKVSGYKGSEVKLNVTSNVHAMFGMSSVERRDQPCWLWIGTENINNSGQDSGNIVDRCGGEAGSRTMKAEYRDTMYFGPRVFVTGIRVCTNKKGTRVKGFQLRGMQVQDNGQLAILAYPQVDPSKASYRLTGGSGPIIKLSDRKRYVNDSQYPADFRNNCKDWKAWVDCPQHNQVATGVVAHYEAGKKPRAITGIALQCRFISKLYTGASR